MIDEEKTDLQLRRDKNTGILPVLPVYKRPAITQIRLLAPREGSVTHPLQQFRWANSQVEPRPVGEGLSGTWQSVLPGEDHALPRPVLFAWEQPAVFGLDGAKALRYDLEIYPSGLSGEKTWLRDLIQPWAEVENLRIGTEYRWKVTAYLENGNLAAESPAELFVTHAELPRWIHAPGITNIRDLGGWLLPGDQRIRQGMIYRGSEMNSHCEITPEGRKVMLDTLGIRTDLDLRGVGEDHRAVLDPKRVEYINLPLQPYALIAHPEYTGRYRALFRLLSMPSTYPVYIHCWGGADRAGTVAFLIGALLGMSEDNLALDYELTSLSIWGERLHTQEAYQDMLDTLALFSIRGSSLYAQVEHFLHVIGVTDEEIADIRSMLIEKA